MKRFKQGLIKGCAAVCFLGVALPAKAGKDFEQEVWNHLGTLYGHISSLQTRSSIPGPQGERGERGLVGPQGPRGESALAVHYKAGPGIVIENDTIRSAASHRMGELYQGGLVFWLDSSGHHGLVVSMHDLNDGQGIQWRNGDSGNKITNARSDGIHAGDINTRLIVASQTIDNQAGNFAALVASTFSVQADGETACDGASKATCYGGWYLPSRYELRLLAQNAQPNNLTTFSPDYYWSSTEASVSEAWLQAMPTGEQMASEKASTLGRVRAVHAF